jgi:hypothetical protein
VKKKFIVEDPMKFYGGNQSFDCSQTFGLDTGNLLGL